MTCDMIRQASHLCCRAGCFTKSSWSTTTIRPTHSWSRSSRPARVRSHLNPDQREDLNQSRVAAMALPRKRSPSCHSAWRLCVVPRAATSSVRSGCGGGLGILDRSGSVFRSRGVAAYGKPRVMAISSTSHRLAASLSSRRLLSMQRPNLPCGRFPRGCGRKAINPLHLRVSRGGRIRAREHDQRSDCAGADALLPQDGNPARRHEKPKVSTLWELLQNTATTSSLWSGYRARWRGTWPGGFRHFQRREASPAWACSSHLALIGAIIGACRSSNILGILNW